jgi:hypothetical protein
MNTCKQYFEKGFLVLLLVAFVAGCGSKSSGGGTGGGNPDITASTVISTSPLGLAADVPLNSIINVTFSEAMDPATFTLATFTLMQGTTPVSGAVTYAGTTATLTPASNLAAGVLYTATITPGVRDLAGNMPATAFTWTFTTGTTTDTTAPIVSSTTPLDAAAGVALNSTVNAIFSEGMSAATLTPATFTLKQGSTAISGTVTYAGITATFTPQGNLAAGTLYTATITTGVKDLAGNVPEADYTWTFTTGTTIDTTAPTVRSTIPLDLARGVALNSAINAIFSEAMSAGTLNTATFTLKRGSTPVSGTVTYIGATASFKPASILASSTTYTATLGTGVKDAAGNAMATAYTWTFTTGTAPDTTAPTVSSTIPLDVATGVALNSTVNAIFSEVMSAATLNTASFTLKQGTTPVPGTVTYAGTTATFKPAKALAPSTLYTATIIKTGVKDLAGNALAANKVWSFTTGTTLAAGPAPVVLGTAGNYVILAKTGVSTTGTTAVTGNIGVSPAAATYITGFALIADPTNVFSTSSLVTGHLFAADYAVPTPDNLTTAVGDMMTAYTDAAGRSLPDHTELGAGNIDGMTLAPGLYKWGTGVTIPIGVTLSGGANDVWIFQIAQTLSVANGAIVTLSGGAQARNIFWQVAGQATLGTTSDFKGNILCQTAIVLNTGAVMKGRALAQSAVTLDASAVTQP